MHLNLTTSVNCPSAILFNVIADVEHYKDFVPWCISSTIKQYYNQQFKAELIFNAQELRTKYPLLKVASLMLLIPFKSYVVLSSEVTLDTKNNTVLTQGRVGFALQNSGRTNQIAYQYIRRLSVPIRAEWQITTPSSSQPSTELKCPCAINLKLNVGAKAITNSYFTHSQSFGEGNDVIDKPHKEGKDQIQVSSYLGHILSGHMIKAFTKRAMYMSYVHDLKHKDSSVNLIKVL